MDWPQANETYLRNDLFVLSGLGFPGGTNRTYRKFKIRRAKTALGGNGTLEIFSSQGKGMPSIFFLTLHSSLSCLFLVLQLTVILSLSLDLVTIKHRAEQ